jgi:hypothetical protein
VKFDVIMRKEISLADEVYKKITGLYELEKGNAEFTKDGDLLMAKFNGQLVEALVYKGNNTFEGGLGYIKVKFELMEKGETKAIISRGRYDEGDLSKVTTQEGIRFLKY